MVEFNWSEEDILNSGFDDYIKDILLAENNGTYTNNDPSLLSIHMPTYRRFKREYRDARKNLTKDLGNIATKTFNLYQTTPYVLDSLYSMNRQKITLDTLFEFSADFFAFLGNVEYFEIFKDLMIHKRGHLRVQDALKNPKNAAEYHGRCIQNTSSKEGFISLYARGNISDFEAFSHEMGHYIIAILYGEDVSPLVSDYLYELEGNYFQLLSILFILRKLDKELSQYMLSNFVLKTLENVWIVKIQEIVSKSYSWHFNVDKVNKSLRNIPGAIPVTQDDFDTIIRMPLDELVCNINSSLAAIDLFNIATDDLKYSLKLFKQIITSKEPTIEKIYKQNGITYLDNYQNFQKYIEESRDLARIYGK